LVQVVDARFSKTGKALIREISLTLDDFPQLTSPAEIKRKLSIYKTKSDALEARLSQAEISLIGKSKTFQGAVDLALRFAKYREPVLLLGESGTGKEEFAKLIHRESGVEGAFVALNCAGLNENLLESELFGYLKGAFTGAEKDQEGLVAAAENGTLFLDEIAEIPLTTQAKLLRFLNDGSYRRVGGREEKRSNARIIAATNRNFSKMVQEDKFRNDLFQRINTAPIQLPPLRNRSEDVELLIHHFIKQFNKEYNEQKEIELPAIQLLMQRSWEHGNIRELEKMIRRLCMITDKVIKPDDVKKALFESEIQEKSIAVEIPDDGIDLKETIKQIQLQYVAKALKKSNGNKLQAAKLLNVSRIDHFLKESAKPG
jgi:transcriptional regulator with PAS, ATPase and Fis domain